MIEHLNGDADERRFLGFMHKMADYAKAKENTEKESGHGSFAFLILANLRKFASPN
jgi:hypothetical protein